MTSRGADRCGIGITIPRGIVTRGVVPDIAAHRRVEAYLAP
ncbi:hypothetical protein [Nocardia sp. NPDC019395]